MEPDGSECDVGVVRFFLQQVYEFTRVERLGEETPDS